MRQLQHTRVRREATRSPTELAPQMNALQEACGDDTVPAAETDHGAA
jgi:hypothetical protein